ncbi:MAG TPA: hypothetical protein VIW29_10165 [Polyangiaceae bacterium]
MSLCALGSMLWLWGFTVDDALVSCRVASNLVRGAGYRFNQAGPVVDAVTPLGWAPLLAPFAGAGPLEALRAAKALGAALVLLAALWLGRRVAGRTSLAYATGLAVCLGLCAPLGAWAVAGMETGLVTALAVAALGSGKAADAAAALAAGLRPELAPWCASVRLGLRLSSGAPLQRALGSPALVLAAVAAIGVLRSLLFGRAAPLAVFAKPSDLAHGASYALHALVQTGLPLLALAPLSLRRASGTARTLVAAGALHFLALALAGGDWMSLYRLAVPVLPSFVLAGAELWRVAPAWASWLRLALASAMSAYLGLAVGPAARAVGEHRSRLIELGREPLRGARSVAALDVGWVGAATPAKIVDLAGITDESIAMLPGGHTSKRVDDALMRSRDVDALVLLRAPAPLDAFDREVERRVALLPSVSDFVAVAELPLGGGTQRYVVLRKPR